MVGFWTGDGDGECRDGGELDGVREWGEGGFLFIELVLLNESLFIEPTLLNERLFIQPLLLHLLLLSTPLTLPHTPPQQLLILLILLPEQPRQVLYLLIQ